VPGFHIELRCTACGAEQRARTGHGAGWAFEQLVCHRCRTLHSVAFTEDLTLGPCPACGLQLEAWPGRLEVPVYGPCPGCLAPLGPAAVASLEPWD
jgi:hypothetical protein